MPRQGWIAILLFVFPCVSEIRGVYHLTLTLIEMGSLEVVAWDYLELSSFQSLPPV
jgi:hypothetical protein